MQFGRKICDLVHRVADGTLGMQQAFAISFG